MTVGDEHEVDIFFQYICHKSICKSFIVCYALMLPKIASMIVGNLREKNVYKTSMYFIIY